MVSRSKISENPFVRISTRNKVLMGIDDFVKAYEITPGLKETIGKIGISEDYGTRGGSN
ncbi:MAG: hypothetical protein FGF52_03135 [Candidatus Brockarchaeota archaeon]|nr:hypothetical protein [Candidatus Brockarchaeota archaeon]